MVSSLDILPTCASLAGVDLGMTNGYDGENFINYIENDNYNKEKALANGRRPATTGRRPYPLRDGYKTTGPLFKAMASKTFKCKTKEVIGFT